MGEAPDSGAGALADSGADTDAYVVLVSPGGGAFQSGTYVPINDVQVASASGVEATVNGNIALSFADTVASGTVDDQQTLERFSSGLHFRAAATLELATESATDLSFSIPLALVALPPVSLGPSVMAAPYLYARLDVWAIRSSPGASTSSRPPAASRSRSVRPAGRGPSTSTTAKR